MYKMLKTPESKLKREEGKSCIYHKKKIYISPFYWCNFWFHYNVVIEDTIFFLFHPLFLCWLDSISFLKVKTLNFQTLQKIITCVRINHEFSMFVAAYDWIHDLCVDTNIRRCSCDLGYLCTDPHTFRNRGLIWPGK